MTVEHNVNILNEFWDEYLMRIRDGRFSEIDQEKAENLLKGIDEAESSFDKEAIALIWYIPTFLRENGELWRERNGNFDFPAYERFSARINGPGHVFSASLSQSS